MDAADRAVLAAAATAMLTNAGRRSDSVPRARNRRLRNDPLLAPERPVVPVDRQGAGRDAWAPDRVSSWIDPDCILPLAGRAGDRGARAAERSAIQAKGEMMARDVYIAI